MKPMQSQAMATTCTLLQVMLFSNDWYSHRDNAFHNLQNGGWRI